MATINVDKLRNHLMDYCGTAAFSGLTTAALDLIDIQSACGYELCRQAERLGIDLGQFTFDEQGDQFA